MNNTFTKAHRNELYALTGELSIKKVTLGLGRVGTNSTISEVMSMQLDTLKTAYNNTKKMIGEIKAEDVESEWTDQKPTRLINKNEKLLRFLFLLIGYKLNQVSNAKRRAEREVLEARVNELAQDAMSPKEKLKEAQKELAEIGELEELED